MGGDNAPLEIVKGAVMAAAEYEVDIVLVGVVEEILKAIEDLGLKELPKGIEVQEAKEVIAMDEAASDAVARKPDASVAVGLRMLNEGSGAALVSAGSTGVLLMGASQIVGRISGIRRAAMAPIMPNGKDGVVLIECGANVDCKPEDLLEFALMGSYYATAVLGKENPRVGLLNIGTEASKGDALRREAYQLIKSAGDRLNFVGNVEAREALADSVDVVVADGFSGNILLKAIEGTAYFVSKQLKERVFFRNNRSKLAAGMLKSGLDEFKALLNPSEYGGTALLGIARPVIKAHGNSEAYAIRSAIRQAMAFASSGIISGIEENIETIKADGSRGE